MSFFDAILRALPTVKDPVKVPNVRQKLLWTLIALVVFFVMGTIALIGLSPENALNLGFYQTVLASNIGTLITLGIGPIVLASIILQLLVGVKIINLDFSNPKDRAKFSGIQKLVAIILAVVEAVIFTIKMQTMPGMFFWVVFQIVLGSVILIYLDEVVSKYGIGSGIGLFIAANVCQEIIWRLFSFPISASGYPGGLLFLGIEYLSTGATINLLSAVILPILFTLLVFFAVVYAESMHVNIPLTVGRSGMGAKFPVKLMYVSNMPVILAATLFANISMFSVLAKGSFLESVMLPLGNFLTAPHGLIQEVILGTATMSMIWHAIGYMIVFVFICVIFGILWVEIGGQGPDAVARQLQKSGMSIPGFRRDERVLTSVLKRYIPTIVIIGSIFVGLLAFFADITSALGTGTGILLTVGIVYRFYEQLAKEQLFESSNLLKQIAGK